MWERWIAHQVPMQRKIHLFFIFFKNTSNIHEIRCSLKARSHCDREGKLTELYKIKPLPSECERALKS